MGLTINDRPAGLAWSKNYMLYILDYTFQNVANKFNFQLSDLLGNVYTQYQFPIPQSAGELLFRVHEQLDPLVSWTRPNVATIQEMTSNILQYQIQYAAAIPGSIPTFTNDNPLKVIKGGIGDMQFAGAEEIINDDGPGSAAFFPSGGRFLTWVPSGRLMRPQDNGWLLYLSTDATQFQSLWYTVYYSDGTHNYFNIPLPANLNTDYQYRNWYVQTGINQANLNPGNKIVLYYDIEIYTGPGVNPTTVPTPTPAATYRINADYRQYYDPIMLYYRNSCGGWDNILLTGALEKISTETRFEYQQINESALGTNNWFDNSLRPGWNGNTGYISKTHMAALVDLLHSPDCALLYNNTWLPVRVTSTSLSYANTKNALYSTPITFETAGSFTSFPRQLPLL